MAGHEALKANRKVTASSNRTFGLVFAGIFLVLAVWPALRHGESVRWWAALLGVAFGGLALLKAEALGPLNRAWFKLGVAMHGVMSPLIMGLLFYGAVTPFALALKALKKDLLRLQPSPDASYWIERDPPGPAKDSMKQQF